ncbi:hypothetical protein M433DRAFT_183383 [Acidomyces richmondensis BFW]|nr:MAG: hypothetical protein FE78DRAFT_218822 [Acidomyces sp. 'richmondensis']KYG46826.1 hypothetical protein M433DRAFT_183383 [Acidomyces richmondensis BFW]
MALNYHPFFRLFRRPHMLGTLTGSVTGSVMLLILCEGLLRVLRIAKRKDLKCICSWLASIYISISHISAFSTNILSELLQGKFSFFSRIKWRLMHSMAVKKTYKCIKLAKSDRAELHSLYWKLTSPVTRVIINGST